MRLTSFNYKKNDGKVSDRVAIMLADPNNHYFAIDVSELDQEEQGLMFAELMQANNEYLNKVDALMQKYDVVNNYRRFDPLKMTNVVNET